MRPGRHVSADDFSKCFQVVDGSLSPGCHRRCFIDNALHGNNIIYTIKTAGHTERFPTEFGNHILVFRQNHIKVTADGGFIGQSRGNAQTGDVHYVKLQKTTDTGICLPAGAHHSGFIIESQLLNYRAV